jgi:hypothetical protein
MTKQELNQAYIEVAVIIMLMFTALTIITLAYADIKTTELRNYNPIVEVQNVQNIK